MTENTNPMESVFELQRQSMEQSREALEQTMLVPMRLGEATVDSLSSQESTQRNAVELQREAVLSLLDAVDDTVPGVQGSTDQVREVVDDQYGALLDAHAELFENVTNSIEESVDSYDDASDDAIAALDELADSVMEAQAELEDQSVEATEQLEAQFAELQTQIEELQGQIQDVSGSTDTAES